VQRGGPLRLLRELAPFDRQLLDAPAAIVVVGTIDDVVLGFAHAVGETLPDGSELAVLGGLYVDPGAREVGVGEAMMDLVLGWCGERGATGIDAVALPGDRATKNFFERFGLTARAIVVHRSLHP
jgi:GNAT superfamily N-acetyltransferase